MKKIAYYIFIVGCFSFFIESSLAQNTYKVTPVSKATDIEDKIIYALPKTIVKIDVIVQKQERVKGPYAEFASKLLGISEVISNKQTIYTILDATISTYSEPDKDYYYFVESKKSNISVNVSPTGIIQSINQDLIAKEDKIVKHRRIVSREEIECSQVSSDSKFNIENGLRPSQNFIIDVPREEKLSKVGISEASIRKQAEEIADFINQIRQKKFGLLSGDYDDQYSAHAIEFMYGKLDSIENHYLEFFVGSSSTTYLTESFAFEPEKSQLSGGELMTTLFKFSETEGALPTSSTSGVLFQLRIKCKDNLAALNSYENRSRKNSSDKNIPDGFYYRMPEEAIVSIQAGLLQKKETILISQFGSIMNLPKQSISVKFDTTTGSIIEYRSLKN